MLLHLFWRKKEKERVTNPQPSEGLLLRKKKMNEGSPLSEEGKGFQWGKHPKGVSLKRRGRDSQKRKKDELQS